MHVGSKSRYGVSERDNILLAALFLRLVAVFTVSVEFCSLAGARVASGDGEEDVV